MKARKPSASPLRLAYSDGAPTGRLLRSDSSAAAEELRRLAWRADAGEFGGFVIAFEDASGQTEMRVGGSLKRDFDKAYRTAARLADSLLYFGEES